MPYIGNQIGNRFVASQAATRLSGNGSAVAFTLEHAVGSDEDILVSVDGVIQEPSIAYAVSNGTTLTFTAAPSSGTNNIFVCYLFRTVATVDHPSTSSLQATDATFTGDLTVDTNTLKVDSTNNRVGIGVTSPAEMLEVYNATSPAIQLNDGGDYQAIMRLAGNDLEIRGSSGALELYNGAADGDSSSLALNIDASGRVTKPLNPSFRAMGNNGAYITTSPVPFPSVSGTNLGGHNTGSHYNTSNFRFTAPVAGRYLLHVHMGIVRITANSGNGYPYLRINSTSVAYSYVSVPTGTSYHPANITQVFELAANDYVDVTFGGSNSDYYGNYTELSFSGCLIG